MTDMTAQFEDEVRGSHSPSLRRSQEGGDERQEQDLDDNREGEEGRVGGLNALVGDAGIGSLQDCRLAKESRDAAGARAEDRPMNFAPRAWMTQQTTTMTAARSAARQPSGLPSRLANCGPAFRPRAARKSMRPICRIVRFAAAGRVHTRGPVRRSAPSSIPTIRGPAAAPSWKPWPPGSGKETIPRSRPRTRPIPKAMPSTSATRRSESPSHSAMSSSSSVGTTTAT